MSNINQEVINVILEKLSSVEIKIKNVLLDVQVSLEIASGYRIFAIVECHSSSALFIFETEQRIPTKFSDLTINRIIPIDEHFDCDTNSIPSYTHYKFTINYKTLNLPFILENGTDSKIFEEALTIALSLRSQDSDFHWLEKFSLDSDNFSEFGDDASGLPVCRQKIPRTRGSSSRESMFRFEMESRKAQYTKLRDCSIFVGTWNVNGQPPPPSLSTWLSCDAEPPILYAVGFQELDLSKEAFLFSDSPREAEWERAVVSSTHPGAKYRMLALIRLVGIQLIVLIHIDHYGYVRDVAWDTCGTGILGKMGNKGGVAIRIRLYDTTLCFVNSHLAAHQDEVQRRNQDYRDISDRINFRKPPQTIKEHDQVYWLGDLNYRINKLTHEEVKRLLHFNDVKNILKYDQLGLEQSSGRVFEGYTENEITFQPTYKYDLNTDKFDSSEKARAPAWCDRILYRGKGIHQVTYRSHMDLRISDHKPVSALFRSDIAVIDETKQKKVQEEVFKLMDKLENEILPQVTVDQTEVLFGMVKFKEPVTREIIVANTGQVPVEFNFVNKINEDSYCKDWLRISPYCGSIFNFVNKINEDSYCKDWLRISPYCGSIEPGEKCDIRFEVNLEQHLNKFEDILVLHLENGKDIFISVSGDCQRSCFTTSISVLCRCSLPILLMSPEQLRLAEAQQSLVLYSVPRELWLMVDFLYRNGLKTKDLFESTALHDDIMKIRDWLDYGSLNPILDNVSAVAECLLLFLQHTKDPIVPYYQMEKCALCTNFNMCQMIVAQLPDLHRNVFLYVIMFLKELLKHSAENGTDVKICTILSIYLFRISW
ncbi:Endonuclease-reverse transcriptase [Popillia japonica]|uniref:Endonuclease-reverse transcriptase n=1 Tax=Popillia japonica TaxID=7064 RepID=A0AAW1MGD6_POPJA